MGISVVAVLASLLILGGVSGSWLPPAEGTLPGSNGAIAMGAGPPRGIWMADPAGTGYGRIVAHDSYYSFTQAISPDGNEILYIRGNGLGSNSLRIVGVDGSNDRQIVPVGPVLSADWLPDGTKILYSTWVNGVGSAVYLVDPDGFNTTEIKGLPNGFFHKVSPDGTKIAFEGVDGCWKLLVADIDGSDYASVYDGDCNADIAGISWSPGGSKIAIASRVPNDSQPPWWECDWQASVYDIVVVNVNGSGSTNLTNTRGVANRTEVHPVFSPDGTKIAFASTGYESCVNGVIEFEHEARDLYVMNVDGSGEKRLTQLGMDFQTFGIHSGAGPVWQPCSTPTMVCGLPPVSSTSSTTSLPTSSTSSTTTAPTSSTTTTVPHVGTFIDDDGSVFEADIEWLAAAGITKGCNPPVNDRFCPDDPVTRGQMAAFLVRALGYTDDGGGDLFTDDDATIFERDIDRLGAAGVTRGCNPPVNDRFCPDDPVTRGQMAAFLVRALGLVDGGPSPFIDTNSSVFEDDITRLAKAGITRGCNPPVNDRFCPDDPVTRGQMAAFLRRALD